MRGWSTFPRYLCLDYSGRQFQVEFVEQDLLMIGRSGDAAFSDFDAITERKHDIHQTDLTEI